MEQGVIIFVAAVLLFNIIAACVLLYKDWRRKKKET